MHSLFITVLIGILTPSPCSPMSMASSILVLNFGDHGEEVDDEVNSSLISKLCVEFKTMQCITLLVNGKIPAVRRAHRCTELGLDTRCLTIIPIEDWRDTILGRVDLLSQFDTIVVQHNAPIGHEDSKHASYIAYFLGTLRHHGKHIVYITQGTFGKCVNTGGGGLNAAQLFVDNADISLCSDSVSNIPFDYTFTFETSHISVEMRQAVFLLFLKNTLGRAPANGYCRHLVGPTGANYITAKKLFCAMGPAMDPPLCEWHELVKDPSFAFAVRAAEYYCDVSNSENSKEAEQFAETKRNQLTQTRDGQIYGLALMLTAFHKLFGVSVCDIMSSSDPAWVLAPSGGAYNAIYNKVSKCMASNSSVEWTPAYDVTCGALMYAFLIDGCKVKHDGQVAEWFDLGVNFGSELRERVLHYSFREGTISLRGLFDKVCNLDTVGVVT